MARMHTRKRGRSSSHRIYDTGKHEWIKQSDDEIVELIKQMKSEKMSKSLIGIRLRDQYGIPGTKYVVGKKISTILRENGIEEDVPEDLYFLINKYKNIKKHLALNKKDTHNTRSKDLIMAKILRLIKYYKRKGRLPSNWKLERSL